MICDFHSSGPWATICAKPFVIWGMKNVLKWPQQAWTKPMAKKQQQTNKQQNFKL